MPPADMAVAFRYDHIYPWCIPVMVLLLLQPFLR